MIGLSFASGVEIKKTGDTFSLACTQYHHLMEGRGMIHAATRAEYLHDPQSVHADPETAQPTQRTMYPEVKQGGQKWGMAIGAPSCIGSNAASAR